MKSFRIKKNEVRKRIYLAGGIKTPFRKPVLPLRLFVDVHEPGEYRSRPLFIPERSR